MSARLLRLGLSLVLAAVLAASLLYVSPVLTDRLRAIPARAHVVYHNDDPAWFLSFFPSLGSGDDDFSKVWKEKFQGLENAPLTVATVPFRGREGGHSWVAVSELSGWQTLVLRWRLMLRPPVGVSPSRSYAVWPIWKLEHPSIPIRWRIRFTIVEGLLVCSVSRDSHDIYKLIDTVDGRAPSMMKR